ncbi:HEWD family protein [Halovenus carboxidivorans]|uniref:HEWD family protein n=1 Tax=Halovenus carboxidivorans TaxID=2692199 RepID=UPI00191578DF|nr:HEWD family protein [Halovenus carboxidivorans]
MVTIDPPTERTCERCGRVERWDEDSQTFVADDEKGTPHCLHEWDINGQYNPLQESES